MNFLELVQDVIEETGTDDASLLTDVEDPPNSHIAKCVNWVKKSWTSIQLQSPWRFMTKEGTFNTVSGQESYDLRTIVADFREIIPYTQPYNRRWIRLEEDNYVTYVPYRDWAGQHRIWNFQPGRPVCFTIDPDDHMILAPEPNEVKAITFDYLRTPQVLAVNNDVPILPLEYHEIIVYRAMIRYAGYDEAATQYQRAIAEYSNTLQRMRKSQLPEIIVRGNL